MIILYVCAISIIAVSIVWYFLSMSKSQQEKVKKVRVESEQELQYALQQNELEAQSRLTEENLRKADLKDFVFETETTLSQSDSQNLDNSTENNMSTDFDALSKYFEGESKVEETEKTQEDLELDALLNFDFDSIKGKSLEEVAEIVKDLPVRVQEFILSEVANEEGN